MEFREYQATGVSKILTAFASSRRVLYCLPVGGGKTYVACGVMAAMRPGRRALVIAHRIEILRQMRRSMRECGIDASRVIIRSPQRSAGLSKEQLDSIDIVIVDEAHHAGSPSYRKLLARMPEARILGLTATPHRRNGLREDFDDLLVGPSPQDLVDQGVLVAPRCWSVPEEREPDLKGVGSIGGDYNRAQLERAINKPHLVGDVVREWKEHAAGRSTLVFTSGMKHAAAVLSAFVDGGVDARFLCGKTEKRERERTLADFDAGRFQVLINILLLGEGVDVHRIDCVQLVRPTRSLVLFLQTIGRGMRPSPTGFGLLVLDHSGAWRKHDSPLAPRDWSLEPSEARGRRSRPMPMAKRCEACGFMTALSAVECKECGTSFQAEDPDTKLEEVVVRPRTIICIDCGCPWRSRRGIVPSRCFVCRKRHVSREYERARRATGRKTNYDLTRRKEYNRQYHLASKQKRADGELAASLQTPDGSNYSELASLLRSIPKGDS